jgi:hypothetical protein
MNKDKTTLNFPLNEAVGEVPEPKKLPNKKQVRLLFKYADRGEAKALGAKWNSVEKMWYYPSVDGNLPEELLKYKCNDIHIEYDDKEYWKEALASLKWDANRKVWMVNEADYKTFLKIA